eukprot:TRINITY_DN1591_c0_g1_i2.p1 TRINITY_DN1591_c0_g1~~TRINITY_DN1591_c0_g1_i2.p1  ORF type:complete len:214 (+),score=24.46 TRINITY_DN1591_c0_g1_i2:40-642(+)
MLSSVRTALSSAARACKAPYVAPSTVLGARSRYNGPSPLRPREFINQMTIMGRVGKDPYTHTWDDGNTELRFSVVVPSYYKDSNGEFTEKADWFHVHVRNQNLQEKLLRDVRQGCVVYAEGRAGAWGYNTPDGQARAQQRVYVTGYNSRCFVVNPSRTQLDRYTEDAPMGASKWERKDEGSGDEDDADALETESPHHPMG